MQDYENTQIIIFFNQNDGNFVFSTRPNIFLAPQGMPKTPLWRLSATINHTVTRLPDILMQKSPFYFEK